jgi:3-hydroxyisobutyrate dehydrogenase
MEKLAFVGVGLLGSALAEAALGRGAQVTVWNRTPAKAEALVRLGARVGATPAEAVQGADRVHIVVDEDATVDALLEAAKPGLGSAIVCDHTTASPTGTAARAARCEAEGIAYLHCPVFMGPAAAREAKGTMMVAGPRDRFDRVYDGLSKMAGEVWYVGARPDLAAVYKLVGNAMIIATTGVVADVLQIAAANDVPALDAVGVFGRFDLNGIARMRVARMASGEFGALFALDMARKDVRLMLEAAGDGPLAVLPGLAERMDELVAEGEGGRDLAVLARDSRKT